MFLSYQALILKQECEQLIKVNALITFLDLDSHEVPLAQIITSPEVITYLNSRPWFQVVISPNGKRLAAVMLDPALKQLQVRFSPMRTMQDTLTAA